MGVFWSTLILSLKFLQTKLIYLQGVHFSRKVYCRLMNHYISGSWTLKPRQIFTNNKSKKHCLGATIGQKSQRQRAVRAHQNGTVNFSFRCSINSDQIFQFIHLLHPITATWQTPTFWQFLLNFWNIFPEFVPAPNSGPPIIFHLKHPKKWEIPNYLNNHKIENSQHKSW